MHADLFLLQDGPGVVLVVTAVQVIDVEGAVVVGDGFVPAEGQLITLDKSATRVTSVLSVR